MRAPDFDTAQPLHTDADVLDRVRGLVGPASTDHQLWIMLVDGDGRQAPVVMPISDVPRLPDRSTAASLGAVLAGLRADLRTATGPGSVIFTLERLGADAVLPTDRGWAEALVRTCESADVPVRGIFLSTPAGVRRLR